MSLEEDEQKENLDIKQEINDNAFELLDHIEQKN